VARVKTPKSKRSKKKAKATGRSRRKPALVQPGVCPLTGLPRGGAARKAWASTLADALQQGHAAVLALVDVDDFDRHARELGDERADALLAGVAQRLCEALDGHDGVGRLAGDVFGVVLVGVEVERALGLLDAARAAISKSPIRVGRGVRKRQVEVTASVGLATLRRDAADLTGLVERAQGALWRAKSLGGDRVGLPARERMALKTSYYAPHQLAGLKRLADRTGLKESVLLRAAIEDLLLKHKDRV
jgi:diguanylate cyclase (GGDEF)-like protein